MNFTLNDRAINFELDNRVIDFTLNDQAINFKLNAVQEVPSDTCYRILEDGVRRLMETGGGFRLLEDCASDIVVGDNSLDATLDFTL